MPPSPLPSKVSPMPAVQVTSSGNMSTGTAVTGQRVENAMATAREDYGYVPNPLITKSELTDRDTVARPRIVEPDREPRPARGQCLSWTKDGSHRCTNGRLEDSTLCFAHIKNGGFDEPT